MKTYTTDQGLAGFVAHVVRTADHAEAIACANTSTDPVQFGGRQS